VVGRQNADIADTLRLICHGKHFLAFCTCGAHWRHLPNASELTVCSSDVALHQITLTTCCVVILHYLLVITVNDNCVGCDLLPLLKTTVKTASK